MEFKKDKLAIIFLIILLVLGAYIRFTEYDKIGYTHDALLAVTGSVAWFYPMPYFPGKIYMGPPLGNMIIGAGCMLSGEDFSEVSKVTPKFSPNVPALIGKQMENAESYCKAPVYIFGFIFLILISLLSILLFKSYYALFPIAFFAFSQFILQWSRIISVDVISYVFIFSGLIFLWLAYNQDKGLQKENLFFILAFISFGLAGATKLSSGIYLFFSFFIVIEKYWQETKLLIKKMLNIIKLSISEKIKVSQEVNINVSLVKNGIIYLLVYLFVILIPYKLNPKNLLEIIAGFKGLESDYVGIKITTEFFKIMNTFIIKINTIDLIIFIFSIFVFIKLILKKDKKKNEKYILYLVTLFLFTSIFFESTGLFRVAIPFLLSLILLMGLSFSNNEYSFFNMFRIPVEKRRILFFLFIAIYILYSLMITIPHSPYYLRGNEIVCLFERENCDLEVLNGLTTVAIKPTVLFLESIMFDNETFLYQEAAVPQIYSRHNDDIIHFQTFDQNLNKQLGRTPNLLDEVKYFHPEGRNLRYFVVQRWNSKGSEEIETLKKEYKPSYIIKLDNKDIIRVYDLYNLTKK